MKSYFPKKIKKRWRYDSGRLKEELLAGKRCQTCLERFGKRANRGRPSVRARTVKINSNVGANLALLILRHHRDIFKNESPTDHRFSNSTSFKVCDPHLVKFSGLFKEKKVRKKDPFFSYIEKTIKNSNSQISLNSQESVRSLDFGFSSGNSQSQESHSSQVEEQFDVEQDFEDSGNFETLSTGLLSEAQSELLGTEKDSSDDEDYIPRLIPEAQSESDEEIEEEIEEIIVPVFWRSSNGAKKNLKIFDLTDYENECFLCGNEDERRTHCCLSFVWDLCENKVGLGLKNWK